MCQDKYGIIRITAKIKPEKRYAFLRLSLSKKLK